MGTTLLYTPNIIRAIGTPLERASFLVLSLKPMLSG